MIDVDPKTAQYQKERLKRHKQQLKQKLTELFQIDSPDLDFGVYRIMNQKREEILRFMNTELIEAVDAEFGKYDEESRTAIMVELAALEQTIREIYGDDALDAGGIKELYRGSAKGRELHEKWQKLHRNAEEATMGDLQKAEIFAHLEEFFSRYYKDGDFLSLRRYAANEKYAVPYNGEEVLLHWANKDQYYIKTDRFLKGHGFDIGSYRVMFEVVKVEGQSNGNGKGRYFVLAGEDAVAYDDEKRLLTVRFAQMPLADEDIVRRFPPGTGRQKPNQDDIVGGLASEILRGSGIPNGLTDALQAKERDDDKNPRLYKHVMSFSKENTSDFFIHKDLGGFLRQELDFYIKNEVFRLDDLGTENEVAVERYVKRAKVLKAIAHRIIDFLAQLEDFQKILWEKKKFVLRAGYCMTLDHVPEKFYPEILANEKQLAEWKSLYGIDEAAGGQTTLVGREMNEAFLRSHPFLVIDTAFFDEDFTDRLLERLQYPDGMPVEDLDEAVRGLMIKSENWQALNLLQERYREKVKCIYIDPPYNTGNDEFIYRDNYQHSSWLSLLQDRLYLSGSLLQTNGSLWINISDIESAYLRVMGEATFGKENFICDIAWEKVYSPRMDAKQYSESYDHLLLFSNLPDWKPNRLSIEPNLQQFPHKDEKGRRYRSDPLRKWGKGSLRSDRPNLWYPIVSPNGVEVWPIKPDGTEGRWRWEEKTVKTRYGELDWLDKGHGLQPYVRQYADVSTVRPLETLWKYEIAGSTHASQEELKSLVPKSGFTTPKPTKLIQLIQQVSIEEDDCVLDFFAGSGTTAHAVLIQNKENYSNRQYILIEIGDSFDTVTKPRIQKVMFSSNWKDGKPLDTDGQSHIFKYIELEQYEDTLNNIEFLDRDGHLQATIFGMNDYMLRYFLDFETRASTCRLNVDQLATPFAYTLRVRRDIGFDDLPIDGDGFREVTADLVETFNYLLGLHVRRRVVRHHADFTYRIVHGVLPDGKIATVVWRNSPKDPAGHEQVLEADAAFITDEILQEFPDTATLYVNSHCFAPKAMPIEPEFKKRMGA